MPKKKNPARKDWDRKGRGGRDFKFLVGLLGLFICILPVDAWSQSVDYPFKSGERVRYGAYYNLDFIWLQSGEVNFRVDTLEYDRQKAWHLEATGRTYRAYDLLMSVRDTFETYSNYQTFRPIYSHRNLNHGKENSIHQYWFDYKAGEIKTNIIQSKKEVYQGDIPVQDNAFDLLATAYKFRKFNFDKLFVGQKVPYKMIIDKQVASLYFRYLGKEIVKTRNGQKYRCHKVSIYLLQGDFFPDGEDMKVWFTDDRNHLPVQVETQVLIGSVKALLLDAKQLKYPVTSKLN